MIAASNGNVELFDLLTPFINDAKFYKRAFKILVYTNYNGVAEYHSLNRFMRRNSE